MEYEYLYVLMSGMRCTQIWEASTHITKGCCLQALNLGQLREWRTSQKDGSETYVSQNSLVPAQALSHALYI